MIDDHMYPATQPWDLFADARIRATNVVDPDRGEEYRGDPNGELARFNRSLLVELGVVYGHEGTDWQNPNVWQGTGVLVYPSEHSPGLVPNYGVGIASNYGDVLRNVQATQHLAVINV